MQLKEIVETVALLPVWAKVLSLAGVTVSIFTLILAPRSASADKEARMITAAGERISRQLGARNGCAPRAYPLLGFGVTVPSFWSVEDAAALLAGGDVSFVKRYEETKAAVGLKFRFRTVQRNYVADPVAEEKNELDVLAALSPSPPQLVAFSAGGREGKVFQYDQVTGRRTGDVRLYWLRVFPEVKLEISAFVYTDSKDRAEFWREVDDIVSSLVLDNETFTARMKTQAAAGASL